MNDMVERYVHQVGRYLPKKERDEIQTELRSLILDQLDDRYPTAPTSAQIAAVLTELGDPRQMAASYGGQHYLIGPALYPNMMGVLQQGWLYMPMVVAALYLVGQLAAGDDATLVELFWATVSSAAQATAVFSAVVVLVFAILERSDMHPQERTPAPFDPHQLPAVDDPTRVDMFEAASGVGLGIFFVVVFLYFLRVGGLTWHVDLSDPGEVVAVPTGWLIGLVLAGVAQVGVHLWAMRHGHWRVNVWLAQIGFEIVALVCLYFGVLNPLFEHWQSTNPELAGASGFFEIGAEVNLVILTLLLMGNDLPFLVRLINHRLNPQ